MTLFSGMLFLHVASALGIFAALSLEAVVLRHLRRALTAQETRAALDFAPGLPAFFGVSAIAALLTGVYLAMQTPTWPQAWFRISMIALVLIAPLGAISGRKMKSIRALSAAERASSEALMRSAQNPVFRFSLNLRIALVLAIVFLMTAKPGPTQSLAVTTGFLLAGIALAGFFGRKNPALPIARIEAKQG
jgi:uncharacterized membrane protein